MLSIVSKLIPAKVAEAITALIGVGLQFAVAEWGSANHWVQIAVAVATVLGVGGVANADQLAARRAVKSAAKRGDPSVPKAEAAA